MNKQPGTVYASTNLGTPTDVEREVLERYARGSQTVEPELCCPSSTYDSPVLEILPKEIIEKDYGCGDPSKYVREGETVVDLGSGAGKICYILSHKVGQSGNVIGLDFNDSMLALSRKYLAEMKDKLGYGNVRFCKVKIQDMALDLERVQQWLEENPISNVEQVGEFRVECERLRREEPIIPDNSVDVVVSNCVLNLVKSEEKVKLFEDIFRVLKRGGRAVISDIVCDEDPTPQILNDPKLWSGCIAGAFREDMFLEMFEKAGFYGIEILSRSERPWQTIDGVEFRSMTVRAYKGKEGPCLERNQAVIYSGPWKHVTDDDGHTYYRGKRMAVCDKTFHIMTDKNGPYFRDITPVQPNTCIPIEEAQPFACNGFSIRHPRKTKGVDYKITEYDENASCCSADSDCC